MDPINIQLVYLGRSARSDEISPFGSDNGGDVGSGFNDGARNSFPDGGKSKRVDNDFEVGKIGDGRSKGDVVGRGGVGSSVVVDGRHCCIGYWIDSMRG